MGRGISNKASGANLLFGSRQASKNAQFEAEHKAFEAQQEIKLTKQQEIEDHISKGGEYSDERDDDYQHIAILESWTMGPNKRYHREKGPAVTREDGSLEWRRNGMLHREDGPALDKPGSKEWYLYGQRHRSDGPAATGIEDEYWLCGTQVSEKEFNFRDHASIKAWEQSMIARAQ